MLALSDIQQQQETGGGTVPSPAGTDRAIVSIMIVLINCTTLIFPFVRLFLNGSLADYYDRFLEVLSCLYRWIFCGLGRFPPKKSYVHATSLKSRLEDSHGHAIGQVDHDSSDDDSSGHLKLPLKHPFASIHWWGVQTNIKKNSERQCVPDIVQKTRAFTVWRTICSCTSIRSTAVLYHEIGSWQQSEPKQQQMQLSVNGALHVLDTPNNRNGQSCQSSQECTTIYPTLQTTQRKLPQEQRTLTNQYKPEVSTHQNAADAAQQERMQRAAALFRPLGTLRELYPTQALREIVNTETRDSTQSELSACLTYTIQSEILTTPIQASSVAPIAMVSMHRLDTMQKENFFNAE